MNAIRTILDKVLSTVCVVLFVLMVCIGTYQIVIRYFFNNPSTVSEELLTYSFTWMSLLAASLVFGKRDHMRMGFMADKITGLKRKVLEIAIECLVMTFSASVLVYGGFSIMQLTMTQKTASLGVSMGIVYSVVPLSGIIILIYGILNIIDMVHGKRLQSSESDMEAKVGAENKEDNNLHHAVRG